MDPAQRRRLEDLAMQRLQATRLDEEQWSFLFRTEGSLGLIYCPWSAVEDWEFDGDLDGLELPWSDERIEEIEEGDDPTEAELTEWRRARGRENQLTKGDIVEAIRRAESLPGMPRLSKTQREYAATFMRETESQFGSAAPHRKG